MSKSDRYRLSLVLILGVLCVAARAQTIPRVPAAPAGIPGQVQLPSAATRPGAQPPIDLEGLARRFEATKGAAQQSGTADNRIPDGLFVFVSLGMPKDALTRIVQQAERASATLVLRGLVDKSLTATAMAVKDVIGERKVSWMIDPRLFKLYRITAVPVTVMVEPGASMQSCQDQRCNGQANFAKVTGDVSLRYALEEIERSAHPYLAAQATTSLKQLSDREGFEK